MIEEPGEWRGLQWSQVPGVSGERGEKSQDLSSECPPCLGLLPRSRGAPSDNRALRSRWPVDRSLVGPDHGGTDPDYNVSDRDHRLPLLRARQLQDLRRQLRPRGGVSGVAGRVCDRDRCRCDRADRGALSH